MLWSGRLIAMAEFDLTRPESHLPPTSGHRVPRWLRWLVRWRVLIIATAITAVLLGLVVVSPVFLNQIGNSKGIDWTKLGNIGQAYGGASAILAGIALIGISGSLIIQVRQAATDRGRLIREQHNELLRIVMENPKVYAPAFGTRTPNTTEQVQQFLFITMSMNRALLGYELGVFTKRELREEMLPSMFATEPARRWWEVAGKYWSPNDDMTRRRRQFAQLVNDEYRRVIASGWPPIQRSISDPAGADKQKRLWMHKWTIPVSAAIGVGVGIFLRSVLRRTSSQDRRNLKRPEGMTSDWTQVRGWPAECTCPPLQPQA
jgi:Family of unknown function (DUF6082)